MIYRIIETELALRDLESIVIYFANTLENESAGTVFLDDVEKCYADLQTMPYMYSACTDPQLRKLGFRKAVVRNYILVYKIDEQDGAVNILRFFHKRQDYDKLL